jgi:hypothetical protein
MKDGFTKLFVVVTIALCGLCSCDGDEWMLWERDWTSDKWVTMDEDSRYTGELVSSEDNEDVLWITVDDSCKQKEQRWLLQNIISNCFIRKFDIGMSGMRAGDRIVFSIRQYQRWWYTGPQLAVWPMGVPDRYCLRINVIEHGRK